MSASSETGTLMDMCQCMKHMETTFKQERGGGKEKTERRREGGRSHKRSAKDLDKKDQ